MINLQPNLFEGLRSLTPGLIAVTCVNMRSSAYEMKPTFGAFVLVSGTWSAILVRNVGLDVALLGVLPCHTPAETVQWYSVLSSLLFLSCTTALVPSLTICAAFYGARLATCCNTSNLSFESYAFALSCISILLSLSYHSLLTARTVASEPCLPLNPTCRFCCCETV